MSEKYVLYNTDEVVDAELDALAEKYPNLSEDEAKNMIQKYIDSEHEILKSDMKDDEKIVKRFMHTVEEEGGDIWICLKLCNVNRFQKMFGTEPE